MWCIVSNCYNDSSHTNSGISYHLFPKEPSLCTAWLEGLHMSGWEPDEYSAVCSIHFQQEDLLVSTEGRCAVRPGAVPANDGRLCRICFATDNKLYSMKTHKSLSKEYETLTGLLTDNEHNLPPYLCSECARRLLDCAHFRTTSLRAHSLLLNVFKKLGNVRITLELIQSVNGLEGLHSLIKTDYDLDIELSEKGNVYTEGQVTTKHTGFCEDVNVNCIKVENDDVISQDSLITKNITNNNLTGVSGLYEDIAEVGIKTENEDANNFFYTDVTTDVNMASISSIQEDVSHVFKLENDDVINQDIVKVKETTNDDRTCISGTHKDIAEDGIKIENEDEINIFNPDIPTNNTLLYISSTHQNITAGAKVENYDVINQDIMDAKGTTNDDRTCISGTHKDIEEDGINIEKDDGINIFYSDITTNNNMMYISSMHQDSTAGIKVENYDAINEDTINIKDTTNDDVTCVSSRNKDIDDHPIKSKSENLVDQCIHNFIDSDAKNEDEFVAAIQKANLNFTRVEDVEKVQREVDPQQDNEACSSLAVNRLYCGICHYETNSELLLLSHLKAHSAAVMYKCHICSYMTIHKNSLKLHLKSHPYGQLFSCNVCNKTFKQKCQVKRHLMTHSGEKPFSCDICKKSFNAKGNLKMHIKTHFDEKPFSCYICNKTFYENNALTRHMRIHSGEKPFSCDICNKAVSQKSDLARHLNTHLCEKPFSCKFCSMPFTQKHHLIRHLRIHNVKNPLFT